MKTRFLLIAALLLIPVSSQARTIECTQQGCSDRVITAPHRTVHAGRYHASRRARITHGRSVVGEEVGESFLSHPFGCPRIAFCACGASVEIFGHSVRALWPASAWYRFPSSAPGPGMVAVRSHHVFVLRYHISGSIYMTADYNSGGHRSRLHAQSISGYRIVNPHGGRFAMR